MRIPINALTLYKSLDYRFTKPQIIDMLLDQYDKGFYRVSSDCYFPVRYRLSNEFCIDTNKKTPIK